MKKGITPEAAQRLSAFLQKRAQNYQDTEEWSPADAVEDVLSGQPGMILLRALSSPAWSVEADLESIFDGAYSRSGQEFDARFQEAIDAVSAAVSAEGFPTPDPGVWEGLKQGYREQFDTMLGELRRDMYDAFEKKASDLAYGYQEAAIKEFQKAASGTPGGTVL